MICVIVARAGSKRLPSKNTKELLGKPLFMYTIQAAIQSNVFSEIIVSTDDLTIKELTLRSNSTITIHDRNPQFADDKATVIDVIKNLAMERNWNLQTEICVLSPCTPFRTSKHIQEAYEKFINSSKKVLGSVQKVKIPGKFHRILQDDGSLRILHGIVGSIRPAEHIQEYLPTGATMMIQLEELIKGNSFYPDGVIPIEFAWPANHDIDTIEDWQIADKICRLFLEEKN